MTYHPLGNLQRREYPPPARPARVLFSRQTEYKFMSTRCIERLIIIARMHLAHHFREVAQGKSTRMGWANVYRAITHQLTEHDETCWICKGLLVNDKKTT